MKKVPEVFIFHIFEQVHAGKKKSIKKKRYKCFTSLLSLIPTEPARQPRSIFYSSFDLHVEIILCLSVFYGAFGF